MSTMAKIVHGFGAKLWGDIYVGNCPEHEKPNPALVIDQAGDGYITLTCRAGCSQARLKEIVAERGFTLDGQPDDDEDDEKAAKLRELQAEIDRLADLTEAEYMLERKEVAKRFDIPVTRLDKAVEKRRGEHVATEKEPEPEIDVAAVKEQAGRLLACKDILGAVAAQIRQLGVTGETRLVMLTYLIVTTRVFDRIVSMIVKGPSAAGKSFTIQQVLKLFPKEAYFARTSLSEKALIYSKESMKHRMLAIYEAAAFKEKDFLIYLIRTLLSEGKIIHEVTDKETLTTILIEKEGPTGLIVTTTAISIEPETETRLISIPADDTPEQTAAILDMQAEEANRQEPDLSEWHAYQLYLSIQPTDVVIPYGKALAALIPKKAVRLRRDHPTLRSLIKAHALLHQEHRQRDNKGAIIATLNDYAVVRHLVNDLISDAAGVGVRPEVIEVRQVVEKLLKRKNDDADDDADDDQDEGDEGYRRYSVPSKGASIRRICIALKVERSTAWRRVNMAIDRGHLKNLEDKVKRPARIALGDPIPEQQLLLPTVKELRAALGEADRNTR